MDPQLESASLDGDTLLLNKLLQHDPFLLHNASSSSHLAAVKVILAKTKTPSVICLLRNKDGMMPIHAAAAKGRIDVMKELMEACPESATEVTYMGESVVHLAVRSNCFGAVEFLMQRLEDDVEILKAKDLEGNTVLHLAVARKQLQTVKLLLSKPVIMDVINATNTEGLTALDLLLESSTKHGDLALGEAIQAAGGRTTVRTPGPPPRGASHSNDLNTTDPDQEYQNTPGSLMMVAALIATITFQAGLNPPGGFAQANGQTGLQPHYLPRRDQDESPADGTNNVLFAGKAVLGDLLTWFLIFDVAGLFASLSIILVLTCTIRQRKKIVMGLLVWMMWVAVLCTAIAFQCALTLVFNEKMGIVFLTDAWMAVQWMVVQCLWVRFVIHLLGWVGWLPKWKWVPSVLRWVRQMPSGARLMVLKRIVVVFAILGVGVTSVYINIRLVLHITPFNTF